MKCEAQLRPTIQQETLAASPGLFRPVGEDGFLKDASIPVMMPLHLGS